MIKVLYILNIGIIKLIDAALFQKKKKLYVQENFNTSYFIMK